MAFGLFRRIQRLPRWLMLVNFLVMGSGALQAAVEPALVFLQNGLEAFYVIRLTQKDRAALSDAVRKVGIFAENMQQNQVVDLSDNLEFERKLRTFIYVLSDVSDSEEAIRGLLFSFYGPALQQFPAIAEYLKQRLSPKIEGDKEGFFSGYYKILSSLLSQSDTEFISGEARNIIPGTMLVLPNSIRVLLKKEVEDDIAKLKNFKSVFGNAGAFDSLEDFVEDLLTSRGVLQEDLEGNVENYGFVENQAIALLNSLVKAAKKYWEATHSSTLKPSKTTPSKQPSPQPPPKKPSTKPSTSSASGTIVLSEDQEEQIKALTEKLEAQDKKALGDPAPSTREEVFERIVEKLNGMGLKSMSIDLFYGPSKKNPSKMIQKIDFLTLFDFDSRSKVLALSGAAQRWKVYPKKK